MKFDLSHSTLAFLQNSVTYSAFDLNLYSDSKYSSQFWTSKDTSSFEVTKSGDPGITTTANLTLEFKDSVPNNLWYKFSLQNTDIIPSVKSQMIIDREAYGFTKINVVDSLYDGERTIVGVGTTTFTYNLARPPIKSGYGSTDSSPTYDTTSLTAKGTIKKVKVTNTGFSYKNLPGISSIVTTSGEDVILEAESKNLGSILATQWDANGVGWNYPSDPTLRGVANLPEILKIEPLSSFKSIGTVSYTHLTLPTKA